MNVTPVVDLMVFIDTISTVGSSSFHDARRSTRSPFLPPMQVVKPWAPVSVLKSRPAGILAVTVLVMVLLALGPRLLGHL
jgi:hypothetical protein